MKKCELCKAAARAYCESDAAYLCWDCDSRVHGANFLVERHVRGLLCGACQTVTSWTASGPKLSRHTVTICESCAGRRRARSRYNKNAPEAPDGGIEVISAAEKRKTDGPQPDLGHGPTASSSSSTVSCSSCSSTIGSSETNASTSFIDRLHAVHRPDGKVRTTSSGRRRQQPAASGGF